MKKRNTTVTEGIIYVLTDDLSGRVVSVSLASERTFEHFLRVVNHYKEPAEGRVEVKPGYSIAYAVRIKDYAPVYKMLQVFGLCNSKSLSDVREVLVKAGGTEIYPVDRTPKPRAERLTFSDLGLSHGAMLRYTKDSSVVCTVFGSSGAKVMYKDRIYSLSGLVQALNGGGHWQGGRYFTYNGCRLTDMRKERDA